MLKHLNVDISTTVLCQMKQIVWS